MKQMLKQKKHIGVQHANHRKMMKNAGLLSSNVISVSCLHTWFAKAISESAMGSKDFTIDDWDLMRIRLSDSAASALAKALSAALDLQDLQDQSAVLTQPCSCVSSQCFQFSIASHFQTCITCEWLDNNKWSWMCACSACIYLGMHPLTYVPKGLVTPRTSR
jgi:hypothetical protein